MKKILTKILTIALMLSCFVFGAYAASNNETIQALLNRDMKVMLNGVEQTFTDVKGTTVYPISYNGTTYLPIRAISERFNTPIEWDSKNYTVWIGDKPEIPEDPFTSDVPWDTTDTSLLANKTATADTEYSYLVTDVRELRNAADGIDLRSLETGAFSFKQRTYAKDLNKSDLIWIDVSGFNYLSARFVSACGFNSDVVVYDESYNILFEDSQVDSRGSIANYIPLNGAKKIAFASFVPFEREYTPIYPLMTGWVYMATPKLSVDKPSYF